VNNSEKEASHRGYTLGFSRWWIFLTFLTKSGYFRHSGSPESSSLTVLNTVTGPPESWVSAQNTPFRDPWVVNKPVNTGEIRRPWTGSWEKGAITVINNPDHKTGKNKPETHVKQA